MGPVKPPFPPNPVGPMGGTQNGPSPLPPRKKVPYNKQIERSPEEMERVKMARQLILGRKVDYKELDTPITKMRYKGDSACTNLKKVEDRVPDKKPLMPVKEGFIFKKRMGRIQAKRVANVMAKQRMRKPQ